MSGAAPTDASGGLRPPPAPLAWAGRAVVVALVLIAARNVWTQIPAPRGARPDRAAQLQAIVRDRQPPGRDGWGDLVRALDRFAAIPLEIPAAERTEERTRRFPWNDDRVDWSIPLEKGDDAPAPDPLDPIFAPERRAVAAHGAGGTLAALDDAADADCFVRPIEVAPGSMILEMQLSDVPSLRQLARALRLHADLARRRGDWTVVEQDDRRIRTIARALGAQATLIEGLVGLAIAALERDLREALVADPATPVATLRALLAIEREQPFRFDPRRSFAGERLSIEDMIDHLFTDDGRGDGVLRPNVLGDVAGAGTPGFAVGGGLVRGRRDTMAAIGTYFRMLEENLDLTIVDRAARGHDVDAWIASLGPRHVVVRLALPALGRAVDSFEDREAEFGAMRVRIALEIVRRERGVATAEAAALVPDPLDAMPLEPFTGGPLRLAERTDDDGVRRIVIYAPGFDGRDDVGDPTNDVVYGAVPTQR